MNFRERREKYRRGLSALYIPIYDFLCIELPDNWGPVQGYRSFQDQARVYAMGRTLAPIGKQYIVTYAEAGESPHQYGCASDWIKFDVDHRPIWKLTDEEWRIYEDAVKKVGAKWGGLFSKPDLPHNELFISKSWKDILWTYRNHGMDAAQKAIDQCRI